MLRRIGRPAVGPLIAVLEGRSKGDVAGAAQLLGELNARPAVGPLIARLKHKTPLVRQASAESLGEIGDRRAVKPLIALLAGEREEQVVRDADLALGRLRDPRAIATLIKGLENDFTCSAAAVALTKFGSAAVQPLCAAYRSQDSTVREGAVEALGGIPDPRATAVLIRALRDADSDIRRVAAGGLGQRKAVSALPGLTAALKDPTAPVRDSAAMALVKIGDRRAAGSLAAASKDKRGGNQAAFALAQMGDARAVGPLVAILKRCDERDSRTAASALGRAGKPGISALLGLARDRNAKVRRLAVEELAFSKDPRAVSTMLTAMSDSDAEVRIAAASAFDLHGDKKAARPLIGLLKDRNARVRGQAASSLGRSFDSSAVEPLIAALKDEDEGVRFWAVESLSRNKACSTQILAPLLKDWDSNVRWNALRALGTLNDPRAVDALIAVLRDKHPKFEPAPKRVAEERAKSRAMSCVADGASDSCAGGSDRSDDHEADGRERARRAWERSRGAGVDRGA